MYNNNLYPSSHGFILILVLYFLHSCQVKLTGELILSFPAGIIRHLVDNPSLNPLSFRMKNTANIEQYRANKPLIVEYVSCRIYRELVHSTFCINIYYITIIIIS